MCGVGETQQGRVGREGSTSGGLLDGCLPGGGAVWLRRPADVREGCGSAARLSAPRELTPVTDHHTVKPWTLLTLLGERSPGAVT